MAGKSQAAANAMRVLIQEVLDLIGKESGREEKERGAR
jgi:hypothetical protein